MNYEKIVGQVVGALVRSGAHRATKYVDEHYVVKATRRGEVDGRSRRVEYVVTVGQPNYRERDFIKLTKKAGEPFPIRKIQLK